MFGQVSIDSFMAMQKPYDLVQLISASLFANADNVFNVGDTALYPDNAFTICHWAFGLPDQTGAFYYSGRETTSSNRQWLELANSDSLFYFQTSAAGSTVENLTASFNIASNLINKWNMYTLTCTRVAGGVRKDIVIYNQDGFVVSGTTGTYTGMFNVSNLRLNVGAARNAAGNSAFRTRMASFAFWKKYMNAAEIRDLWNYGRGLQYSQLTTEQKTSLVEWWNLDNWNATNCTGNFASINLTRNTNGTTSIFKTGGDTDLYVFNTNGTFSIVLPYGYTSLEYLIVGGGGSGGGTIVNNSASGGGGGGEVKTGTISNPSGGTWSLTVGAGGVAIANNSNAAGNAGGNSTFNSITAVGGKAGAGGAANATNSSSLEGAGGGSSVAGFIAGGSGTNSGGNGTSTTAAGGGGGSNGVGSTASSVIATPNGGGSGTSNSITGSAVVYGAGGGSFAVHGTLRNGTTPTAGTGEGSSGRNRVAAAATGAAGGTGCVIIKLTK